MVSNVCAILETPFHMDIDLSLIVRAKKKTAKDATNHLSHITISNVHTLCNINVKLNYGEL